MEHKVLGLPLQSNKNTVQIPFILWLYQELINGVVSHVQLLILKRHTYLP